MISAPIPEGGFPQRVDPPGSEAGAPDFPIFGDGIPDTPHGE